RSGQCAERAVQWHASGRARRRGALLYADRSGPARRRGPRQQAAGRRSVRNLSRPRAGILMRRRLVKIALVALGLLLGLPLLGLVVLLIGANTDPGCRLIERAVANLSHGVVTLDGMSGRFPNSLRVEHITVSDAQGAWLTIGQARLDWSPSRLLHGEVKIDAL